MRINLLLPAMTLFIAGSGWASAVFSMEPDWTYKVSGSPTYLCIQPLLLNDDAYPDLIVGNRFTDKLTAFYGQGDGSFTVGEEYSLNNVYWVESADVNNDGDCDVLARAMSGNTDSIYIYENNGSGILERAISLACPEGIPELAKFSVVDLNNDSNLDLVTIKPQESIYAMFGDGVGGFKTVLLYFDEDTPYEGFCCGDIDNDGDIDIVIICWQKLSVLLNDGNGSLTWNGYYWGFSNEGGVGSINIGYLDSDSYPDIASMPGATLGEYSVYSFLGDGLGGFTQCGWWVDLGFAMHQADINDYNLDGFNDAFFTGCDGNLLMLGDGTGNLQQDYLNFYMSQCEEAAVIDLDLDGDIDYVTASGFSTSDFYMEVFLNKTIQNGIGDAGSGSVNGSLLLEVSENPISTSSEVHFSLPVSSNSSLIVYDIYGREADVLQEGYITAGEQCVTWDTVDLPTGCYTLVLRTDSGVISRRCVKY